MDMKKALGEAMDREYPRVPDGSTINTYYMRISERAAFANGFGEGFSAGMAATAGHGGVQA